MENKTATIKEISVIKSASSKVPICEEPCPIERGMRLIGGRWKGSILWHLKDGPLRFNELANLMGGASRKMVNSRLKEMENLGLLTRTVLSDRPIAVQYEITPFGMSSLAVLARLKAWTEEVGV